MTGLEWGGVGLGYVGPAAGIAIAGSLVFIVVAVILGGLTIFTSPLIWLVGRWRRIRRPKRTTRFRRVVVLGFDGMDPTLVETAMAQGQLPALAQLAADGSYQRLGTTFPAISPAAWASFSTGLLPAKHGIFDFIALDRAAYRPEMSSFRIVSPPSASSRRRFGPWRVPTIFPRSPVVALRRGQPFWKLLGDAGYQSAVLRVPMTFPPEKFNGRQLSGMCLPDLRGTQGTYTIFSTRPAAANAVTRANSTGHAIASHGGEYVTLSAHPDGRTFFGQFPGPPADSNSNSATAEAVMVPIAFTIIGDATRQKRVRVTVGHEPSVWLVPGEFSPWVTVPFTWRGGRRITGACRFLVRSFAPDLVVYATPVMLDPRRPALPISHPFVFAPYLARTVGPFATLGLAEDTWALDDGVIAERDFLDQAYLIQREREKTLDDALAHTPEGVVVAVFDATDRIQHMFWRELQTRRNSGICPPAGAIADCYAYFDRLVARVRDKLRPDDLLWVISDHGFADFSRQLDLNAWLRAEGYLAVVPEGTADGWLNGIDWGQTRAFAVGLSGIYLNVAQRESKGIVPQETAAELAREIAHKLLALRDADHGDTVAVTRVVVAADALSGPFIDRGPDLLVGCAPGYRVSWASVRGAVGEAIFADNDRRWSGDHGIDPAHVPGIFFSSAPIAPTAVLADETAQQWQPHIADLAPSLLRLFGLTPPATLDGRAFAVVTKD